MIVDSSAIVAILFKEPEGERFALAIEAAPTAYVSAASVLECSIVLRADGQALLDDFLRVSRLAVQPISLEHLGIARTAQLRYGRRSGSPARLNFGDCFSYALARSMELPLLFKGDDFIHTDITPAIP